MRGGLGTFDPISANLSYYATMADSCSRAADWRDKIRVWFAPPGWVPANLRPAGPQAPFDLKAMPPLRPARRPGRLDPGLRGACRDDRRDGGVSSGRRRHCRSPTASASSCRSRRRCGPWAALLDGRISIAETLYVFAAALTCSAYALGWPGVEDVAKPAAMALLIARVRDARGRADVKRLVTAALAASLVGDTLLLSPSLFRLAFVAFLVAHGFYIAAFSRGVGFLPSRIAAVAIGAFAALVFAYVWPGVAAGLKIPVVVYAAMVALRRGAGRRPGDASCATRAAVAVAFGGVLFMLSDMTIALVEIRRRRLAGRSMDAADLLSGAGADRVLRAAARAALQRKSA